MRRRQARRRQAGFTLVEVLLAVAIIGIISAIATPMLLSYYQGAQVRVAAEQVTTFLNQGRQLAITQNGPVCVHISQTAMHYHLGTCGAGATWIGPGTDAAGNFPVPAGITLSPLNANVSFNYLGGTIAPATLTITHTASEQMANVVVALSGRVSITPYP
jgi:prepilin-type N-terminal cleavage/methylation domain-containing protein